MNTQSKFKYGPGLPGYGTKGIDGSSGLLGISNYFSDLDGDLATDNLKTRISNNETLMASTNDKMEGFEEGRIYQNGDYFTDSNTKVWVIVLDDAIYPNKYKYSGTSLNAEGFFEEGPAQGNAPFYNRVTNPFAGDRKLVDFVYTNGSISDYISNPSLIYKNSPAYYGNVHFVGEDLLNSLNDEFPFQVWTTGQAGDENSIALIREKIDNLWRFGNLDAAGNVRDVSLALDFKNVSIQGGTTIGMPTASTDKFFSNIPMSVDKALTQNIFVHNQADGTVLTNHEFTANRLFDDVFDPDSASFIHAAEESSMTISWDKSSFMSDYAANSVNATLTLVEYQGPYNNKTINFPTSAGSKAIILPNLEDSGTVNFIGLEETTDYAAYIDFASDGWTRRSATKIWKTATLGTITFGTTNDIPYGPTPQNFIITAFTNCDFEATYTAGQAITSLNDTPGTSGTTQLHGVVGVNTSVDNRQQTVTFTELNPSTSTPFVTSFEITQEATPVSIVIGGSLSGTSAETSTDITITSNVGWALTGANTGFLGNISPTSGNASGSAQTSTINFPVNTLNTSRTQNISVDSTNGPAFSPVSATITQGAATGVITLTPPPSAIAPGTTTAIIKVTSNGAWQFRAPTGFINSFNPQSGNAGTDISVSVNIDENLTTSIITADAIVEQIIDPTNKYATAEIIHNAAAGSLAFSGATSWPAGTSDAQITLTANAPWTLSHNTGFITAVSPTSSNNVGANTINLTFAANLTIEELGSTLTAAIGGYSVNETYIHEGATESLEITQASVTTAATGTTAVFDVVANAPWSLSGHTGGFIDSWSATSGGSAGPTNTAITATFPAQDVTAGYVQLNQTITATQSGSSDSVIIYHTARTPSLTVSSATVFDPTGSTITSNVSNYSSAWEVDQSTVPAWITLGATAAGTQQFSANSRAFGEPDVSDTVTFRLVTLPAYKKYITFTQDAIAIVPAISIDPISASVYSNITSAAFDVSANTAWTISATGGIIASTSISTNTVTANFTANTSTTTARTGTVSVNSVAGTEVWNLTQQKKSTISISSSDLSTEEYYEHDISYTINSNTSWSYTPGATWITPDDFIGDFNLSTGALIDENPSGVSSRTASIEFTTSDGLASDEVVVTQLACLSPDTPITMADGTFRLLEDIVIGDSVMSRIIPGLKDDETNVDTWNAASMVGTPTSSIVTRLVNGSFKEYYLVNDMMKITYEHHVLIFRDGIYRFIPMINVIIGDYLWSAETGNVLIESKDLIVEQHPFITMDVEETDVYFAHGLLVHNPNAKITGSQ